MCLLCFWRVESLAVCENETVGLVFTRVRAFLSSVCEMQRHGHHLHLRLPRLVGPPPLVNIRVSSLRCSRRACPMLLPLCICCALRLCVCRPQWKTQEDTALGCGGRRGGSSRPGIPVYPRYSTAPSCISCPQCTVCLLPLLSFSCARACSPSKCLCCAMWLGAVNVCVNTHKRGPLCA